jgi:hypothetical protein
MNFNLWKDFNAAALAGVLFLSLGLSAAAQSGARESSASNLEGTWTVQVTLVDCTTGNPLGTPFSSLLTFARGGTATETTANPIFYPAERGPGHGVWSRIGKGSYSATSTAFITLNGALTETQKITQAIQLRRSSDSFTSTASVEFFDPAGNLLATGCATAAGQRFK